MGVRFLAAGRPPMIYGRSIFGGRIWRSGMDTLLFSCKSILNFVKNAVYGYRMIIDHRQTCDLSSLFYFMQIEISASSRNPTCKISLVFLTLMCVFPPFSCLSVLVDTLHLRCAPRRCFCSSDCTEMPVCLSSCDGLGCVALCTLYFCT